MNKSNRNDPLVLVALSFLTRCLKFLMKQFVRLIWLPIIVLIVSISSLSSVSGLLAYYSTILIRAPLIILFFPAMVSYFAAVFYAISYIDAPNTLIKVLVHGSLYVFLGIIIFFGIKKKRFKDFVGLVSIKKFANQFYDIAGFVSGILSVILVSRSLKFFRLFSMRGVRKDNISGKCFRLFMLTLLDYFTLPFLLIIVFTYYRLNHVKRLIQKKHEKDGKCHITIMRNAMFLMFIDLPCYALTVLVFATLYRIRPFITQCKKEEMDKKFIVCLKHSVLVILDLPFFAMGLILLLSVLRSYHIIKLLQERDKSTLRTDIVKNIVMLVFDIPYFVALGIIYVTMYQKSYLRKIFREEQYKWENGDFIRKHLTAILLAALVLIEIVTFVIMIVLMLLVCWRYKIMFKRLKRERFKIHQRIWIYIISPLFYILHDYFYLIQIVILALLSLWRCTQCVRKIRSGEIDTLKKLRNQLASQIGESILDVIHLLITVVIVLSIYRIYPFLKAWKKNGLGFRAAARDNFGKLLGDLPFIILSPLTLCRLPFMLYSFKKITKLSDRRKEVIKNIGYMFFDVPAILFALILLITVYRFKQIFDSESQKKKMFKWRCTHKKIFLVFAELIADLPFIVLSPLTLWRLPFMLAEWKTVKSVSDRRTLVPKNIGLMVVDIPAFLCISILLVSVYRFKSVFIEKKTQEKGKKWRTSHVRIFTVFGSFLVDLPFILLAPFTLHRIILVFKKMFKPPKGVEKNYLRLEVVKQFYYTLLDIPCAAMTLIMLVTVYRFLIVKKNFTHKNIFLQFLEFLMDLPFIVVSIFALWRIPQLIINIRNRPDDSSNNYCRVLALKHVFKVILDIPCFFMLVIIFVFVYRIKQVWKKTINHKMIFLVCLDQVFDIPFIAMFFLTLWRIPQTYRLLNFSEKQMIADKRREIVFYQVVRVVVDIPFILCCLILIVTIIGLEDLKKVIRDKKKSGKEKQYEIIKLGIIVPITDIHTIICTYTVIITLYRIFHSIMLIRKSKYDVRKVFQNQAGMVVLDILALLSSLIVLFTFVRIGVLYREFKKNKIFVNSIDIWETSKLHFKIYEIAWNVAIDSPLFVLWVISMLSVWRVGILVKIFNSKKLSRLEKYKKITTLCLMTIVDPIFLVLFLILTVFYYRGITIYRNFPLHYKKGRLFLIYGLILREFSSLMVDIVFYYPPLLVLLVTLYRIRFLKKSYKRNLGKKSVWRILRGSVITQFKETVIDLPLLILSTLYCFSFGFFRIKTFYNALFVIKSNLKRRNEMKVLLTCFVLDFFTFIFSGLVLVTVWRLPYFLDLLVVKRVKFRIAVTTTAKMLIIDIKFLIKLFFIFTLLHRFPVTFFRTNKKIWKNITSGVRDGGIYFRSLFRKRRNKELTNGRELEIYSGSEKKTVYIPGEILFLIFTYLPGNEIVSKAGIVCKKWKEYIHNENYLWHVVNLLKTGVSFDDVNMQKYRRVFIQTFPGEGMENYKREFIRNHGNRRRKIELGVREIINQEFRKCFSIDGIIRAILIPIDVMCFVLFLITVCVVRYPIYFNNYVYAKICNKFPGVRNITVHDRTRFARTLEGIMKEYREFKSPRHANWLDLTISIICFLHIVPFFIFTLSEPLLIMGLLLVSLSWVPILTAKFVDRIRPENFFLRAIVWFVITVFKLLVILSGVIIMVYSITKLVLFPLFSMWFHTSKFIEFGRTLLKIVFYSFFGQFDLYYKVVFKIFSIDYLNFKIAFFPFYLISIVSFYLFKFARKILYGLFIYFRFFPFVMSVVVYESVCYCTIKYFYAEVKNKFPEWTPATYFVRLIQWIGRRLEEIINFVVRTIKKILNFIYKVVKAIVNFIWKIIKKISNFIWKVIKKILRFIFITFLKNFVFTILETIVRTVYNLYYNMLFKSTIFARKFGLVAELLLFPISFIWIFWPIVVPVLLGRNFYITFIPAGLFSVVLLFRAKKIIQIAWDSESFEVKKLTLAEMDEGQKEKLEMLKKQIRESKKLAPKLRTVGNWLNDECYFLYLRGKKWSVESAKSQLENTIIFRADKRPDLFTFKDYPKLYQQNYLFNTGFTKDKQPIVYLILNNDKMPNTDEWAEKKFYFVVYVMEKAIKQMKENVEAVTWIIDLKNSSINVELIKSVKSLFSSLGDYYTERLGRACIVNAPWSFGLIWSFVKSFLDSMTKKKFKIMGKCTYKNFESFIEKDQLLKRYGGERIMSTHSDTQVL